MPTRLGSIELVTSEFVHVQASVSIASFVFLDSMPVTVTGEIVFEERLYLSNTGT